MKKYFLYARKSLEDDGKQIQSIPDQIFAMRKKAKSLWITIVRTFEEKKSAKSPWRPVFNEMIEGLRRWEAEWIVTWKLDRLSRNPIDSGTIQYMLQTWELEIIVTNDRNYADVDAWLLFSVESWIWNQFILDLKKNVKRWLDYKTWRWIFCAMAPEWYLNNKANATIEIDPERFDLVKKMWEYMLSWNYTVKQIMHIANEDWGFRRRKKKKLWGNKLMLSGMYRMFNNVFYTWDFMWKGEIKKGTHKPMITYDEFYRVQEMIWEKWIHIAQKTREFAYTGFVKCWECGSAITATEKHKTILSTGEERIYVYYHCTKRKQGCQDCTQKPIKLNDLEEQINALIVNLEILPEFKKWWLEILKKDFQNEITMKEAVQKKLQSSIDSSEKKLKNLTEALISELIEKEEYLITKNQINADINQYKSKLWKLYSDKDESFESTEKLFEFISLAKTKFNHWDLQTKKEIFRSLGLNWTLKDWKLHWLAYPWVQPIQKFNSEENGKKSPLELIKKCTSKPTVDAKNSVFGVWYSTILEVRKAIAENWWKIYLPSFMNDIKYF